jgi:hypothetical protein
MKATEALNSLYSSKYISVNTKKIIFYTVIESILSYGWEIWAIDNKWKKKLFAEMDFWRRAARPCTRQRKDAGTTIILERVENKLLNCYEHVVRMEV